MIRQNLSISAISTRRCVATTWRWHCAKFHSNTQNQFNVEQDVEQKTTPQVPYRLVGRVPLGSQNMKELESDIILIQSKIRETVNVTPLVLHMDAFTCEKILTNDPTRHERKIVTIHEMQAERQEIKQAIQESKQESQILRQTLSKERQTAWKDRQAALKERQTAWKDRLAALKERQTASKEGQTASKERQTASKERQTAWKERQQSRHDEKDLLERTLKELELRVENLEDDKRRRHVGEVVNIREKLALLVLCHEINKQRKQQLDDPKDIKAMKEDRNSLAYEIDLYTTLEQMATHPGHFDICSITVFGETQNKIQELLTWDKDRECNVYNIFNEHGDAWHSQFANTCIEPFNKWLSAIHALKRTESAMLESPSSYLENPIQKQKDVIKEAIREWKETFLMDKSEGGMATRVCQKAIKKDYKDRGLIDRIEAALLKGVVLTGEY
ncbi:hypothetical protein BofuT4_P099200.1 [Botrytis cinerea T4]|uniref:Uncharacterized protein n=1 Tax=Botryotinia fuckeliana (strain T4) TaxID=999810 RepID=G2YCC3_BOTF4|nr:hypothetical protein BofuT4_P099200.1 [Botrytis cinerea T4]